MFYRSHLSGMGYECLIKNRQNLDEDLLSYEELETLLHQVEFFINSRPLIYISVDDLQNTLTRFDIVYGRNLASKICETSEIFNVTKRYRCIQKLIAGVMVEIS